MLPLAYIIPNVHIYMYNMAPSRIYSQSRADRNPIFYILPRCGDCLGYFLLGYSMSTGPPEPVFKIPGELRGKNLEFCQQSPCTIATTQWNMEKSDFARG